MKNFLNNAGVASMIEVIVTSVIFIIAVFGIFTIISMLKPQSSSSAKRLEAAYIGKSAVDELKSQVDAISWNDPLGPFSKDQIHIKKTGDYTVEYRLTDTPESSVRQLEMTVSWPDDRAFSTGPTITAQTDPSNSTQNSSQ